jgi:predicted transcriptional regulator
MSYEVIAGIKVRYKGRRSVQQVLIDLLRVSTEPIIPTRLMYHSNLSWSLMNKYSQVLVTKGLLKETMEQPQRRNGENKRGFVKDYSIKVFHITPEGLEVLKLARRLEQMLGT